MSPVDQAHARGLHAGQLHLDCAACIAQRVRLLRAHALVAHIERTRGKP